MKPAAFSAAGFFLAGLRQALSADAPAFALEGGRGPSRANHPF
jgi:hypothetical protein